MGGVVRDWVEGGGVQGVHVEYEGRGIRSEACSSPLPRSIAGTVPVQRDNTGKLYQL